MSDDDDDEENMFDPFRTEYSVNVVEPTQMEEKPKHLQLSRPSSTIKPLFKIQKIDSHHNMTGSVNVSGSGLAKVKPLQIKGNENSVFNRFHENSKTVGENKPTIVSKHDDPNLTLELSPLSSVKKFRILQKIVAMTMTVLSSYPV